MGGFLNEKVIPKIMAFVNTKAIQALKEGMVYSMPLIIVGSIFLILSNFPIAAVTNMLEALGIKSLLDKAYAATFNINAMIAVIGIAYNYAKLEKQEPLGCGIIALAAFLLIQPSSVTSANGDVVGGVINQTWTAGQGMVGAIIIGLLVGVAYSWFMKKNITIKMPAGVPQGVANAFSALIPGGAIIVATTVVEGIFELGFHMTAMEAIYKVIQTPLQGLTDSLGGVIVYCFMVPFLWFFGIHGSSIMGGILGGVFRANGLANQAILDSGMALTRANGGHIVTMQFIDQFVTVTGSGITIGIVIYMLAFAKSKQFKTLGRLEAAPALFNINEPILFGMPIVMNPILAAPFILVPIIVGVMEYFAIYFGLCPMYGAIEVPWTCPPIISGFLIGGWRTALLQIITCVVSFFVYLPFVRKVDLDNAKAEAEGGNDDDDDDW